MSIPQTTINPHTPNTLPTASAAPAGPQAFRFSGKPEVDSLRFSGLLGRKKPELEPVTPPDGMMERKAPSLMRRFNRAINKSFPYAIATLILTPFKFVPIINLLAIPAGFLTATATAWNALGGLLDKRSRIPGKKEQPEFVPDPAVTAKPSNAFASVIPTEASVDGNE